MYYIKLILHKLSICLLSMFILPGCLYYASQNHQIQVLEANESRVKSCKLLGQVYGSSKLPYLAVSYAIARDEAKKQAYKIGGTHIYWLEENYSSNPYVLGKAYRCEPLLNLDNPRLSKHFEEDD